MTERAPDAARRDSESVRRAAMAELAASVRHLNDVMVTTGTSVHEMEAVSEAVDALAARLAAEVHPGPYSGLLGARGAEWTDPHDFLPLTPMAGLFNPIAPPLRITMADGEAHGTCVLGRQHTGPPGVAHGGSLASLCDQMVAAAGWCAGIAGVTKSLRVEFRKPVPIGVELHLHARCAITEGRRAESTVEIRVGDDVCVWAEAETVIPRAYGTATTS